MNEFAVCAASDREVISEPRPQLAATIFRTGTPSHKPKRAVPPGMAVMLSSIASWPNSSKPALLLAVDGSDKPRSQTPAAFTLSVPKPGSVGGPGLAGQAQGEVLKVRGTRGSFAIPAGKLKKKATDDV